MLYPIRSLSSTRKSEVFLYYSDESHFMYCVKFSKFSDKCIEKEYDILKQLKCENIVQNSGCCVQEERKGLVTEFLPYKYCLNGRYSMNEKIELLLSLAKALKVMHDKNICYCDIKLDNIRKTQEGVIKLIDFDSCHFDGENLGPEAEVGIRHYRAPEYMQSVYKNRHDIIINKASDIWSFACFMFHLLTKKILFYENMDQDEEFTIADIFTITSIQEIIVDTDKTNIREGLKVNLNLKRQFDLNREKIFTLKPSFKILIDNCLKFDPKKRCSIDQIIEILDYELNVSKKE